MNLELVCRYNIVDFLIILVKIFDDGILIEIICFEEYKCNFIFFYKLLIFFYLLLSVLLDLILRNGSFLLIKVFNVIFLFS